MRNNKRSKKIVSIIAGICLAASVCVLPVSAADGITVKLDDIGAASGYTVKGYYGADENSAVEVQGVQYKNGNIFFAGEANNEAYSNFYYEIYDSAGNKVQNMTVGYIGNLEYAEPNMIMNIEAPVTYEDISRYNLIQSGIDPDEYLNTAPTTEVTEGTPDNSTTSTENGYNYETSVSTQVTKGVVARVTSSVDISAVASTNGIKLTLINSDNQGMTFDIKGLKSEFLLIDSLPAGEYLVDFGGATSVYSVIGGSTRITVSDAVTYLDIGVEPVCTLEVRKNVDGVNTAAEYTIEGVNKIYNTSDGVIAVAPGSSYRVTDKSTGTTYAITIPTTAKNCVLDLGTSTGVPVNDKAYEEAQLSETASEDNPYNIPPTDDLSTTNEASALTRILLCIAGCIGVVFGLRPSKNKS